MTLASYVGRAKTLNLSGLISGFFLLVGAAFIGLMAAFLPLGFMFKLAVLGIGVLVLFVISIRPTSAYSGREADIGFWLLVALVMSVILWPSYFFLHVGASPNINLPVLLRFFILMISVGFLLRREEIRTIFRDGFLAAKGFFVLVFIWHSWQLIAACVGVNPAQNIIYVIKLVVSSASVYIALLCFVNSRKKRDILIIAILFSGFLSALFGLVEFSVKQNPFSNFISVAPDAEQSLAIIRNVSERYRHGAYRIQATFTHPIAAGQFFAMLFFIGVFIALSPLNILLRYLGSAVVPLSIVMIYLTGSRSAYVAVAAGILLLLPIVLLKLFRAGSRSLHYLAIAIFGTVIFFLIAVFAVNMLPDMFEQLLASDKGSSSARLEMLSRGISAIMESPIFGYGPHMSGIKAGMTGSDGYLTIDNYLLTMSIDYGLPVFLAYISVFIMAIVRGFKIQPEDDELGGNIVLLAPVILCYLLIETIASIDSNETIAIVFGFILTRSASLRAESRSLASSTQAVG